MPWENVHRSALLIAGLGATGTTSGFSPRPSKSNCISPIEYSLVPWLEEIVNLRAPDCWVVALKSGRGSFNTWFFTKGQLRAG